MWNYTDITRDEFERIKDHIEEIMVSHGAVAQDIELPYANKTTTIQTDSNEIVWESRRKAYKYKDLYYRISEICYEKKPFIVAEELREAKKMGFSDREIGILWDLSEEEIEDEVAFFLGEKPYPRE